mgnify:CR=1 FL=1
MKAVVIGSGIGGIATSIRLALKGYEVSVLEKNSYPGGKLSSFEIGAYRFDAGPSLFTMPHYVNELFELAGEEASKFFSYEQVEAACHYWYPDGTQMTAWADRDKLIKEFSEKTSINESKLIAHLEHSEKLYDLTHKLFMESPLNKLKTYLNKEAFRALRSLGSLDLLKTMGEANHQRLKNPKMEQYFNRFATYNGSNPYQTPGVLNVIPHLEHGIGTFFPKGGMVSITNSLVALAERKGVKFEFDTEVNSIELEKNKVQGLKTNKAYFPADLIVSNADVYPSYKKLLKKPVPKKVLKSERSSSAIIFYWGINKEFKNLGLHNIFFSKDYPAEFEAIFKGKTLYEDPTVYVNISSKFEKRDAPEGAENWFVMVNAPANTGQDWDELISLTRKRTIAKLSALLGVNIEKHIEEEDYLDPRKIELKTSSFQGSLYGSSSNDRMSAFLRHQNESSDVEGLYFCGGSVHPGGGIPLCLLSAKITADVI